MHLSPAALVDGKRVRKQSILFSPAAENVSKVPPVVEKTDKAKKPKLLHHAPVAPVLGTEDDALHVAAGDDPDPSSEPRAATGSTDEGSVVVEPEAVQPGDGLADAIIAPAIVPKQLAFKADDHWFDSKAAREARHAKDANILRSKYSANRAAAGFKIARVVVPTHEPAEPMLPPSVPFGQGMFGEPFSDSSVDEQGPISDPDDEQPTSLEVAQAVNMHAQYLLDGPLAGPQGVSTDHGVHTMPPSKPARNPFPAAAAAEEATSGLLELGAPQSFEQHAQDASKPGASPASADGRLQSADFASVEELLQLGILYNEPARAPVAKLASPSLTSATSTSIALAPPPLHEQSMAAVPPPQEGGHRLGAVQFSADAAAVLALAPPPGGSPDDGHFRGQEKIRLKQLRKGVKAVLAALTPAMLTDLGSEGGGPTTTTNAARLKQASKTMLKDWSPSKCDSVLRALQFHAWHCEEQAYMAYPAHPDLLVEVVSEYLTLAQYRAGKRELKRLEKGLEPVASQGGLAAAKPIYEAFLSLSKLGLRFTTNEAVKKAAKTRLSPPKVRPMPPLEHGCHLESITVDQTSKYNEYERAYAGGFCFQDGSSGRTIDMQRIARIEFESTKVLGVPVTIACGVPPKSKGLDQDRMAAIELRCPILSRYIDMPFNLDPLMESMPDSKDGCVFRGFITHPSDKHVITNAIAWDNVPATHQQIIDSRAALLVKSGVGEKSAHATLGHDSRHTMAEVGRVLVLSKQRRDLLSNHRITPVFGEDAGDTVAYRQAVRQARVRVATSSSKLASSSDRYSSVFAEPAVADESRLICMAAIREGVQAWHQAGVWPKGAKRQIEDICARARAHNGPGGTEHVAVAVGDMAAAHLHVPPQPQAE